jgi:hypothetical protein
MSFVIINKRFISFSKPKLQLYIQFNNLKKNSNFGEFNVVQENGILKKQVTPRRLIGVQYSKLGKFQIIIPTWIEQFHFFIFS